MTIRTNFDMLLSFADCFKSWFDLKEVSKINRTITVSTIVVSV